MGLAAPAGWAWDPATVPTDAASEWSGSICGVVSVRNTTIASAATEWSMPPDRLGVGARSGRLDDGLPRVGVLRVGQDELDDVVGALQ